MSPTDTQAGPLDPVTFPLHGSRLIEASAGTGKTFTIALLYVRLVLGSHDSEQPFPPPLTPRQILVVTFTELAAGELRDRIRARLVEAAKCFAHPEQPADPLLEQLRSSYPQEQWPHCAWRLQTASQSMDEASVSTIHGWCNRMLVEHAFDTRGLFTRELVTDTSDLLDEVIEDYWRTHFYALSSAQAQELARLYASPAALGNALSALLRPGNQGVSYGGYPVIASTQRLYDCLAELERIRQQQQAAEAAVREHWAEHWDSIRTHLLELQPHLNGTTHGSAKPDAFAQLLEDSRAWAQDQQPMPSRTLSFATGVFRFKKSAAIQQEEPLPAFDLMAEYRASRELEPKDKPQPVILSHAGRWVRDTYAQRMLKQAHMGFDDLLVQLEQALDPEHAGAHAQQLAERLRADFPVALIDEFQDTDPIQYGIFNRIYPVADNPDDCGLFMIGDPKQSIYAFRGADIHTYLQVREATTGRHYTLSKNYRSTTGVVDACNALFMHAENYDNGAFRYRTDGQDPIPFVEVSAQGKSEQLLINGQPAEPMHLWYFDSEEPDAPLPIKQYRQQAAAVAASQIAHWLRGAEQGKTGFGNQQQIKDPLQPADIALLVRTANEARLLSQELAARRIYSVYLSDRESIFASQQARDCLHWLRACAEPTNERLVRAALGTLSLQLSLKQLAEWHDDELAREQQMLQFAHLHDIWRRQGVLVMLRRLQEHYDLPERLLHQHDGERILTNLLHLAEWLQESASQLDGEQALIRHLEEHLDSRDEQQLLRLESDAQRVRILTIHKSKGLEYPLVVLPFISGWTTHRSNGQVNHRIDGRLYTELASNKDFPEPWELASEDGLREDLRLLYVALTRASHALWLGMGPLGDTVKSKKPSLHKSAIGHILNGGQPFASNQAIRDTVEALASYPGICLLPAPEADDQPAPELAPIALDEARPAPKPGYLEHWWIASYSALQLTGQHSPASDEPASARDDQLLEPGDAPKPGSMPARLPVSTDVQQLMHQFPRGAHWGTFLHGLLEWAACHQSGSLQGFAAAAADDQGRNDLVQRRCRLRNIDTTVATHLSGWLKEFLQQPWPAGFSLIDIQPTQQAVELEFLLEVQQVNTQQLDQLIRPYTLGNQIAPQLGADRLNGLLKGFIDLVIEYQGRYYLIDWKSNHLGDDDSAYTEAALQQAIGEYRYDLQYMLYILALHRQLRARLPDYDYDHHMGGAYYSFLRGWQNPETGGLFYRCPPRTLIEDLDQLFSPSAQEHQP